MAPKVSVITSVYNGGRYLTDAVNSILGQTFSDFEFLITDDGSTDSSLAVLRAYAERDARIRLCAQANRGLTRTLNAMLRNARGELIARFDADDIALPERFERQVAYLERHRDVVCVGSSLHWIDEMGRFIGHCPAPESDEDLQRLMLGGVSLMHHPTVMGRRAAILQVGGYDESLETSADLDLWLRLGEVGKLANLKDAMLLYRLHPGSITSARQEQQAADAKRACEKAWKRRNIEGTFTRPAADHINQYEFWLNRARQALVERRHDVACRCALRAVRIRPCRWRGWRLLTSALVRRSCARRNLALERS